MLKIPTSCHQSFLLFFILLFQFRGSIVVRKATGYSDNNNLGQAIQSIQYFLFYSQTTKVSAMGLQFGSFNGICETAALVICPLVGTAQGVIAGARNVDIGSNLIFQPCKYSFFFPPPLFEFWSIPHHRESIQLLVYQQFHQPRLLVRLTSVSSPR